MKKEKSTLRKKIIIPAVSLVAAAAVIFTVVYVRQKKDDITYPKSHAYDDISAAKIVKAENPVYNETLSAVNGFGYKTTAKLFKNDSKNKSYSPISLYYALSCAASGAKGETQNEMLSLLGFPDANSLSEQCGNLYRTLYFDNSTGKMRIANSLWLSKNVSFEKSFKTCAAENFYASIHDVDFASLSAGKEMSDWVNHNTYGKISPVIKTTTDDTFAILNSFYFNDTWVDEFDKSDTVSNTFHTSDNKGVNCFFMQQNVDNGRIVEGENYLRSQLQFKNGCSMVFVLPDEGVSPYSLVADAKTAKSTFTDGESENAKILWKVPKVECKSSYSLIDMLKSLGMQSAFDIGKADFTAITKENAFINKIDQQTSMTIDEKGVKIATFTFLGGMCTAPAPAEKKAEMILDRPFLYGIYSEDGTLLFIGVCENPNG